MGAPRREGGSGAAGARATRGAPATRRRGSEGRVVGRRPVTGRRAGSAAQAAMGIRWAGLGAFWERPGSGATRSTVTCMPLLLPLPPAARAARDRLGRGWQRVVAVRGSRPLSARALTIVAVRPAGFSTRLDGDWLLRRLRARSLGRSR